MWDRARSLPAVVLGSMSCVLAIAACGGSSSPKPHVASISERAREARAEPPGCGIGPRNGCE
jgi:hypothetical protein